VHDYIKPKKSGFEPNQYRNFGFEKSSGIPVFGIPVLKALHIICSYIKKNSLLQNKEHRIFMFQGIVSDFTQNRWSKDRKN
jgi:hypothetical protein